MYVGHEGSLPPELHSHTGGRTRVLALSSLGQLWAQLHLYTDIPNRFPLIAASLTYPAWALRPCDPPTAS